MKATTLLLPLMLLGPSALASSLDEFTPPARPSFKNLIIGETQASDASVVVDVDHDGFVDIVIAGDEEFGTAGVFHRTERLDRNGRPGCRPPLWRSQR